jgi:hypothetical protein
MQRAIRNSAVEQRPLLDEFNEERVVADTFAGRIHVEWDNSAMVTPLGHLHPFYLWAGDALHFFAPSGGLASAAVVVAGDAVGSLASAALILRIDGPSSSRR